MAEEEAEAVEALGAVTAGPTAKCSAVASSPIDSASSSAPAPTGEGGGGFIWKKSLSLAPCYEVVEAATWAIHHNAAAAGNKLKL